jgi:hypothetical protein
VQQEAILPIPNGGGVVAVIGAPDRNYRLLAVDGISNPRIVRTPMLHAIAAHVSAASSRGQRIDIIAGDLNSIARSIGFDRFRAASFTLASEACAGWKGSFPSKFPLYDIDHVWTSTKMTARSRTTFASPATNHRGQLVVIENTLP